MLTNQLTGFPNAVSVSSNEALEIYFEHPSDPSESQLFHPAFTYPIYGEEETIFGYENLLIKLSYAADTLKPRLDITWSAKFDPVGDTKADEVEAKIRPFLPCRCLTCSPDAYRHSARNLARTNSFPLLAIFPDPDSPFKVVEQPEDKSSDPFEPPGELLESYEVNGRSFGIWTASLTDPRVKRILNHTQIFIPMFIEGGTMIELDDPEWTIDRWTVFFMYVLPPLSIFEITRIRMLIPITDMLPTLHPRSRTTRNTLSPATQPHTASSS